MNPKRIQANICLRSKSVLQVASSSQYLAFATGKNYKNINVKNVIFLLKTFKNYKLVFLFSTLVIELMFTIAVS